MIFIIQIRICKLSEGKVMMHINLSRREINLLEDVCYTKLLTIENEAVLEKDSDINEVIKNIAKAQLNLSNSSPLQVELKNIMEKFVEIRDKYYYKK